MEKQSKIKLRLRLWQPSNSSQSSSIYTTNDGIEYGFVGSHGLQWTNGAQQEDTLTSR